MNSFIFNLSFLLFLGEKKKKLFFHGQARKVQRRELVEEDKCENEPQFLSWPGHFPGILPKTSGTVKVTFWGPFAGLEESWLEGSKRQE